MRYSQHGREKNGGLLFKAMNLNASLSVFNSILSKYAYVSQKSQREGLFLLQ